MVKMPRFQWTESWLVVQTLGFLKLWSNCGFYSLAINEAAFIQRMWRSGAIFLLDRQRTPPFHWYIAKQTIFLTGANKTVISCHSIDVIFSEIILFLILWTTLVENEIIIETTILLRKCFYFFLECSIHCLKFSVHTRTTIRSNAIS